MIAGELFANRLVPVIGRFIESDKKAGETANEIIEIWRSVFDG